MTRYVKTVSATGASSGGAAGLSAQDVCGVIDTYLPKYKGQVGLSTTFLGIDARDCLDACCTNESITPCNTTNYPGTDAGLQYATASAGNHMGNWYALAVCNCWTCCYDRCTCLEFSFPTHCYDAFIIRWNGVKICRCCYWNYSHAFGTNSCYSQGYPWSSGSGCCQYSYCTRPGGSNTCTGITFPYSQYSPITNSWQNFNGRCITTPCNKYKGIWIGGDYGGTEGACYSCCGHRTINLEWQFWRYNNHMSAQARERNDRYCDNDLDTNSDGNKFLCAPQNRYHSCGNEFWMRFRFSTFCCYHNGWKTIDFRPNTDSACWYASGAGRGICWNDCCPQVGTRQFSKWILFPCCCLLPHLTSYCCSEQHINNHSSWCIMALNKCVPGFTGATPSYGTSSQPL